MSVAEILAVGTELLLGQVLDTNSQFLSEELARLGIDCYYHTTVGDNKARVRDCLRTALSRSEIVITSGGLGPTPDDLTMECIAEVMGAKQEMDETILAGIRLFFTERNIVMPENNAKQALRPVGADLLPNPTGTAPGIIWTITPDRLREAGIISVDSLASKNRYIFTFPGVPSELKNMWMTTVSEFLQVHVVGATIFSVELRHFGIGESALAEKFSDLLEGTNPTVAPYAGHGECRLRVTSKSHDLESAMKLAQPIVANIQERSGYFCYGTDSDTLESVVGDLLKNQKLTISTAESCTGGLVSKRLTDIPGSSEYVSLNLVTYANEAKHKMLGVDDEILTKHGAVSPECARAMAEGVRRLSGADIGVGVTGVAGPGGGTEDKPVGLVYLGLSAGDSYVERKLTIPARIGRKEIRHRTANEALNMVRLFLLERAKVQV
ncbi:competence/damage-inducible protein A [Candidatus Obscuribacterales bacterium]|nr:competence/damage-inducible protein A [Candidatus Obscuribacterales bacterium]MBX3135500.1 competence/damage-inducible protein A [Candidatus Obscuribacterales bacterium]MBX3150467.1 competence/damage-inducible protein A [Candidatus Obscuribacterales bacterium]